MILSNLHEEKIYAVVEHYQHWTPDIIDNIHPMQEYYFDTVYWLEEIKMVKVTSNLLLEHMIENVCHKFSYVTAFDYQSLIKISKAFSLWLTYEFYQFKPHNTLLLTKTEFSYILCIFIITRCSYKLKEIEENVKKFL